ncbi:hypothetical protein [Nocardia sp. CS682]|uniref:NmrA family NAD(P)-binding protein n=1 Tax=Nocardia sp. CS682 TaxID=1047172 RepID=UPI001074AF20|nr:hypothetical protein [Nocardia sp. CS682]QBS39708.1 hypothetical protein DMB37_05725 [Nocardia sp. CS682]
MTTKTIAVHGATGAQGAAISARFAAAGWAVRPLNSRNADLSDVDALASVYTGADAVLVQLPLLFDPVVAGYAETILAALTKAGIERAVFNPATGLPPEAIGVPFIDARVHLMRELPGAVAYGTTIGPAGRYLENLLQPWSIRRITQDGELVYPLPAAVPDEWVSLDDIGDRIVEALAGGTDGGVTLATGPTAVTGDELAAAVGAAVGRPVRWVQVPPAEYGRLMAPVIGETAAEAVAGSYEQAAAAPQLPLPAELVWRTTTTPAQWAGRQDWTA